MGSIGMSRQGVTMNYVRDRAQGGGMKSQNKGPRMKLKLNVALHFGNDLFLRPIIKQEAKFLMNIGNHQA